MFKIDSATNSIQPLTPRTFGELGFRERNNLQEWISKQPSCLGEDLLIIQKEFAGFSDTNERLDLLALDKQGSLVIIENKLDDTGRDVTWQALKYASYCSRLTKANVKDIFQDYLSKQKPDAKAEDLIAEFLEMDYEEASINRSQTQRIILIAANFRKEVTSTVLWLLNFKLRVHCFRVTPYSMDDQNFMNIEQIIPTKAVEEFMIGIADKTLDEVEGATEEKNRHRVRRDFWNELLKEMSEKSTLFQNISPGTSNWIGAGGSGVRGVSYNFVAGRSSGRAEIYIDRGEGHENKEIYDMLFAKKEAIEAVFGAPLVWEPLENRRACRIKCETQGNIFERDQWPQLISFMTDAMVRMEKAFREPLAEVNRRVRNRDTISAVSAAIGSELNAPA